jgi:hypothetical protein
VLLYCLMYQLPSFTAEYCRPTHQCTLVHCGAEAAWQLLPYYTESVTGFIVGKTI